MTWKASKQVKQKQRLFAKYKDSEHPSYKLAAKKLSRSYGTPEGSSKSSWQIISRKISPAGD